MRFPAWLVAFLAPAALAQVPSYQGLWWNLPANSESGWGLNISHQGDTIFATLFTYDSSGRATWFVVPAAARYSEPDPYGYGASGLPEYRGEVYRTTGPAFSSGSFNPASVAVTSVGDANLTFTSPDHGTFTFSVNGVTVSKGITRQVFSTQPTCTFGGAMGTPPNFQDLWWRSPAGSESGWGINLTHQGDIIFATWFTYGADGRPMWLVMSDARRTSGNNFSGAIYRTTGPAFDAMPWNPAQVTVTQVGTATLSFGDGNNGTFAYTVDGVSQSKSITRQVFSAPATVCR